MSPSPPRPARLTFHCPHCQTGRPTAVVRAGRMVRCLSCKRPFLAVEREIRPRRSAAGVWVAAATAAVVAAVAGVLWWAAD